MSTEAGKSPPASPVQASLDDFQKIALRVGVIVAAEAHPNADRLLVLKVDLGDGTPRQLVAGIKTAYQPADLSTRLFAFIGRHRAKTSPFPKTFQSADGDG